MRRSNLKACIKNVSNAKKNQEKIKAVSKRILKSNCNFLKFDPLQLQLQLHFFQK